MKMTSLTNKTLLKISDNLALLSLLIINGKTICEVITNRFE